MASTLPFKPFEEGDDVNVFLERLEQHFTAASIGPDKQISTLLTAISENVYKTLKSISYPALPKEKSLAELQTALKLRFYNRVSHFRKRIVFDKLQQREGESVGRWYQRIRETAADCEFTSTLEERIKDKLVTGMLPGSIQERLCEEPLSKTTLDLLDIALNKEAALQEKVICLDVSISCMAWLPNNPYVVVLGVARSSGQLIKLFNVNSGRPIPVDGLTGPGGSVTAITVNQSGVCRIAAGDADSNVRIWELPSRRIKFTADDLDY